MHNAADMVTTVSAYMGNDTNQPLWQSNKAISDTMVELNADLTTLAGLDVKQTAPVTGPAADKATAKFDLEAKILLVAGQLAALAAKNDDATLEAQADLTMAGLDKLPAQDLEAAATRIKALATENLAALADYGIVQADLTELESLEGAFHDAIPQPREAVVDRSKETKMIPPLVSNMLSTLRRQLDRQMLTFKQSQPEFYAGYVSARVIVDRGEPSAASKAARAAKKAAKKTPPPA